MIHIRAFFVSASQASVGAAQGAASDRTPFRTEPDPSSDGLLGAFLQVQQIPLDQR